MKYLFLSKNRMMEWPASVQSMDQLEFLDLSENYLTEMTIPFWVSQMRLKNLNLAGNKV